MTIQSIRHRGLQGLYRHPDARCLPPDNVARVTRILQAMAAVTG